MADNRKETKENQTRWIFRDSMVEDLIEALEASKTEYEGRGLDFERIKSCEVVFRITKDNVRAGNTRKQILVVQLQ